MPGQAVLGDDQPGIQLADEQNNPDCREDDPERDVARRGARVTRVRLDGDADEDERHQSPDERH